MRLVKDKCSRYRIAVIAKGQKLELKAHVHREADWEDASDDEQNEMSLVELAAVDLKEWWIVVARVTEVCEGVKPGAGRLSCQLSTVT